MLISIEFIPNRLSFYFKIAKFITYKSQTLITFKLVAIQTLSKFCQVSLKLLLRHRHLFFSCELQPLLKFFNPALNIAIFDKILFFQVCA